MQRGGNAIVKTIRWQASAGGVLVSCFALAWGITAMAAEVTNDRLLNPDKEPQNWLHHHLDYASTRYAKLDQINTQNAKNLKVAWTFALGGTEPGGIWPHGGL